MLTQTISFSTGTCFGVT